jgi:hypothetical protein
MRMCTRRTPLISVLSAAALLMAATFGISQNDTKLRPKAERADRGIRLTQATDYKVMIQDDEPAGQVVDFIVSDGGCIDYIVATHEDQYYLIPYAAADFRYDDSVVFVDIAPSRFSDVQFFAKDDWPDYYVQSYRQNVFATFGVDARRGRTTFRQNFDDDDDFRDRRRDRRDFDRDRDRDFDRDRDGDRDRDFDRDRERGRDRDFDRDRERGRDRDFDRDRERGRDRDRDLDRDRDRDRNRDRDLKRPPPPDRDSSTKKPAPKADPKAPKADPKSPKSAPGTPAPPNPKTPAPK